MPANATLSWRKIPLLRLLIPFLLGIALGWWTNFEWMGIPFMVFFCGLSLSLLFSIFRPLTLSVNKIVGFGVLLWFMCFSYWRAANHSEKKDENHFAQTVSLQKDSTYWWYAEIKEIVPKRTSLRARVQVHAYANDVNEFQNSQGQLLLYLPPDSLSLQLSIGSKILFHSSVSAIKTPLNPDAFDFAAHQAKKNVFHQARLHSEDWFLHKNTWSIRAEAMRWRQYLMGVLRQHLAPGSNELAVGAALILGNKDELEDDIRNAYSATGAIHVLAVSGLHVGFIAWGIGWLLSLGPFGRPSWKWVRLLLSLLGIWAFALLTGLSPSVMRAACMFSFMLIGKTLARKANIYNILAASALFLLLIDPFLIFNIGFQLSYLAVSGIIYFQPRIYKALFPPNKVLDYLWTLSSVALAAQLATLPLSLFYFHQFPVYFLLSGIVVVTAASFILGLGVLLFISSAIPILSSIIGWLLSSVLWLNNAFILALNKLPGGLITDIWIDAGVLSLLYLAIAFLIRFMTKKKGIELLLCLTSMALALTLNLQTQISLNQQKKWTIYHQYKETVIDAFDGRNRHTFSSIAEEDPILNWSINPHRKKMGTKYVSTNESSPNWMLDRNFIGFHEKRMLIIDRTFTKRNKKNSLRQIWYSLGMLLGFL